MRAQKTIYAGALLIAAMIGGGVAALPTAANAQANAGQNVTLTSVVEVERDETADNGKVTTKRFQPGDVIVVPGDKLLFTLKYRNIGKTPASNFVATNPMPGPVAYTSVQEDWAEVSVDGGKSWGKLVNMKVADTKSAEESSNASGPSSAMRAAQTADVTHVRWVFKQAIAPGRSGTLSFRGVVK